jgi:uncharacterized protein (DUF362 family)
MRQDSVDRDDVLQTGEPPKKRRLITRRRVLIGGGAVVATGALGAGGFLLWDHRQRFWRRVEARIPDHRIELPSSVPPMVIAHGSDPALTVRAAVARMGGMGRFVTAEDVVVVKPNIGWDRTPEQAANTHPEVVAEVARLCLEARPKRVIVCDCPVAESRRAFERSGIMKAALEVGADVVLPEESRYYTVEISPRLGTWDVLEPFVTATKIINVPVAKHHDMTSTTAGMKNWIGITGKLRIMFHNDIDRSIAELSALMRPTLTVVDATRVLMHAGPQGGSLSDVKQVGAVAVGVDPVALDAWAFSLFGVGLDALPDLFPLVEQMGLGRAELYTTAPLEIVTG